MQGVMAHTVMEGCHDGVSCGYVMQVFICHACMSCRACTHDISGYVMAVYMSWHMPAMTYMVGCHDRGGVMAVCHAGT